MAFCIFSGSAERAVCIAETDALWVIKTVNNANFFETLPVIASWMTTTLLLFTLVVLSMYQMNRRLTQSVLIKTTTIRWPRFVFSFKYRITCWLIVNYYIWCDYNIVDNVLIVTSYEMMTTNNAYSTQIMMIVITMMIISIIIIIMMTITMMIL